MSTIQKIKQLKNLFGAFGAGTTTQTIDPKQLIEDTTYSLNSLDSATTEDLLEKLGVSRTQIYSVVVGDDEVESCRDDVVSAITSKSWRIYGENTDTTQTDKITQSIRKNIRDIAEQVVLAKMYGFSVARLIYEQDPESGLVLLKRVISRHDELDNYEPKFSQLIYRGQNGEEVIETQFSHLFITHKATSKNPAGEMSIARIYPAVMLRRDGWRYAYQFTRRYAQPYLVLKSDNEPDGANKMFNFRNGGGTRVGTTDDIVLLQNSATGDFFRQLEQMANARIQKNIIGRVKTSELNNGARSAQQVEQDGQNERIDGYLNKLSAIVQQLIDNLLILNEQFGTTINQTGGLWFEFADEIVVDIDRAQRDQIYLNSGAIQLTNDYFTKILGFEPSHFQLVQPNQTKGALELSGNELSGINQGVFNTPLHSKNTPQTVGAYRIRPQNAPNPTQNTVRTGSSALQLSDNSNPQPTEQLTADQQIIQPKIHAILSALASSDNFDEFNQKLDGLDLTAGDQMLIDKLVFQNVQAWANGADAKITQS